MYVYTWKKPDGTPFYVGMGNTSRRMNPKHRGHRNKACLATLDEIGADRVIVEVRYVENEDAAKTLEKELIALYGRLIDGTGTLTNIVNGGAFHASTQETSLKLRALWKDPDNRQAFIKARIGVKRKLAESTKQALRERVATNPAMKSWGERNGKDPEFDAKRIAGIRKAQDRRLAKMADPVALAQRKERLRATLNSESFKEKRKQWDTPEYRAKLSAAKAAYWAARRAAKKTD